MQLRRKNEKIAIWKSPSVFLNHTPMKRVKNQITFRILRKVVESPWHKLEIEIGAAQKNSGIQVNLYFQFYLGDLILVILLWASYKAHDIIKLQRP